MTLAMPADFEIWKWDPINGWLRLKKDKENGEERDYKKLPDGKSVLIRVTDGKKGDLDNVANGVVIDPSGVGIIIAAGGAAAIATGGGYLSGIECFIATARNETPMMMGALLVMILL